MELERYLIYIVVCLVPTLIFYSTRKKHLPLPPGPKGLPIVGNWFQLPINLPWETYTKWSKKYGEIVHVKDFARNVIILNSWKSAYTLLEKRSSIYSGRPQYVMFHELLGFGRTTPSLPYGDTWRKHRKLYNQQMHKGAISQFGSLQYEAIHELLRNLLDSPLDLAQHVIHMSASIVVGFTYGYKLQAKNDPLLKAISGNSELFIQASRPGAFLVDNLPILKYVPAWFPGANFKRIAAAARERGDHSRDMTFKQVKLQLALGNALPSFVSRSLVELGKDLDDESDEDIDAIKRVAGGIFGAGTPTTAITVLSFILAVAVYPDCMKKAQAEIDLVVGSSRLPELGDRAALPYLGAMLKEVLRWFPVVPTALPHATTADDVYEGYRIPAGSVIIPNSWKILHDPESYADPYTFRPERFIPEENGGTSERDPTIGSFGYGRRICSGKNLAEATVWLTMATLLSAFRWTNPVDRTGKTIDRIRATQPAPGGSAWYCTFSFSNRKINTHHKNASSRPQDFTVQFIPRSKELEAIINQSGS
ncbi:hypothetical protein M422DRAFT_244990 [Sphaerobolus stellatus SS14]|nr:hypothetical protein M422DRAFT_244990 [Sphaerobolus stellatus SS14]